MKTLISALGVALCMLLATMAVSAQEMSFRSGVVTAIQPIQVAAQSQQKPAKSSGIGRAFSRTAGRIAGRAAARTTANVGGSYADAYDVGSGVAQDVAETASSTGTGASAGGATTTAYMVMVKFDDGSESAIQAAQAGSLAVGKRVRVFGSGSSAQIAPAE